MPAPDRVAPAVRGPVVRVSSIAVARGPEARGPAVRASSIVPVRPGIMRRTGDLTHGPVPGIMAIRGNGANGRTAAVRNPAARKHTVKKRNLNKIGSVEKPLHRIVIEPALQGGHPVVIMTTLEIQTFVHVKDVFAYRGYILFFYRCGTGE